MMDDRHPSPDYPRDEKHPGDPVHQKGQIRPGSAQSGHGPPPSSLGPPPSYTTVTMTTDNTPGARVTEINLNIGYYKTLPGILKIVQMIFGIICMACASPAARYRNAAGYPLQKLNESIGHNHWFLFVIVTAFIFTFLWSCFYFLQLKDSINMKLPFSWLKLELYYTIAVTILYVLAWIVLLAGFGYCAGTQGGICDARIAAGVFAIFNTVAYGLGSFILWNDYKSTPPELQ